MPFVGPSHVAVLVSNCTCHNCNTEICSTVCDPLVQPYRHDYDSAHSSEAYAMTLTPNSIPMCHKCHFSNPSYRSTTYYRSNCWFPLSFTWNLPLFWFAKSFRFFSFFFLIFFFLFFQIDDSISFMKLTILYCFRDTFIEVENH